MGLSITVQKGHDFSSGNVTRAALNAGATPTIAITGSVGASEIAADSINDAQIKDDADILVAKLKLAHNNIIIGGTDNNASVLAPNSAGLESTNNDVEGNVGFLCDNGTAFSVLRTDLNTAGGHVGIKKTGNNLKLIINTGVVDGNHLNSSVFDDVTVERNNAAIRVKDGGISVAKLKAYKDSDDNVKSGFLTYGQGGTAHVVEATSDPKVLVTAGVNANMVGKIHNKIVDLGTFTTDQGWRRAAHGLAGEPTSVSLVLECVTTGLTTHGYTAGNRIYNFADGQSNTSGMFAQAENSYVTAIISSDGGNWELPMKYGSVAGSHPNASTHSGTSYGHFEWTTYKADFKVLAIVSE